MIMQDKRRCPRTEEVKGKISQTLTGRKLSEEHRQKMSEAKIGKKWDEQFRARVEEAHIKRRMELIGGEENVYVIKEMYENGSTIYKISKKFSVSYATVKLVLAM